MLKKLAVVTGTLCAVMILGIMPAKTAAAAGAAISGAVRDASTGIGIAGARVSAKPVSSYNLCDTSGVSVTTDLDGFYVISGLESGPHRVRFEVPVSVGNSTVASPSFVPQWFGGVYDENAATILSLVSPQKTTDINAFLARGGSISGTVSDATGPLWFVQVTATDSKGGSPQPRPVLTEPIP